MKRYGIRGTLPEGDPLRLVHLLGPDWEWYKWYDTEAERNKALAELQEQFAYYRKGDMPSQVLVKVER